MCVCKYIISLFYFNNLYIVVCIHRFSSFWFKEKGFLYCCTFDGLWWEFVYNFYTVSFFFSLSERMGFKKKPSNFYCLYMFLTYYYVLEKMFWPILLEICSSGVFLLCFITCLIHALCLWLCPERCVGERSDSSKYMSTSTCRGHCGCWVEPIYNKHLNVVIYAVSFLLFHSQPFTSDSPLTHVW